MAVPAVIAVIAKVSEKTEKADNAESNSSKIPEKISENNSVTDAIPEKFGMNIENNNAELSLAIPDKLDVQPYYSSYEERIKQCDKSKGEWTGEIGESKLKPENAEAKAELAKCGKDGIEYKDGIPDFSPFAKDSVEIDYMTADRTENYKQAYKKFAEKWNADEFEGRTNWDSRSVQQYKKEHHLDMHECSDLKTCQLVPHDIHMSAKHVGGRCECSIRDGERSKFDD